MELTPNAAQPWSSLANPITNFFLRYQLDLRPWKNKAYTSASSSLLKIVVVEKNLVMYCKSLIYAPLCSCRLIVSSCRDLSNHPNALSYKTTLSRLYALISTLESSEQSRSSKQALRRITLTDTEAGSGKNTATSGQGGQLN